MDIGSWIFIGFIVILMILLVINGKDHKKEDINVTVDVKYPENITSTNGNVNNQNVTNTSKSKEVPIEDLISSKNN